MDKQSVVSAYRRVAGFYDRVFGPFFAHGQRTTVEAMDCRPGHRVLEVGVGTGSSLPRYPDGVDVVGIDVSPEMLDKAQTRADSLPNDIAIRQLDAQALDYADDSFDKVVAMYVVSVTPDPKSLVDEMKRVCKPDGELFIVNHFSASSGAMAAVERALEPLSKVVGWRPSFPMDEFLRETNLEVTDTRPVNAFGYWTLLQARNTT
ncbi:methyltransferase domain-containing protein [Salinisphaera sp. USBA-960]|uniref:class I SAM-dependent methyltransferase n=1 Tax=Salinisphaera orenii TaxID=856731 RepID=UPI000DBE37EB|nr:methyltransferase domain-containing protein [Salifodinibacter halophilus]NNC26284.1 methyltransferase domain-containing protein [Salifodinibacter halophilus]